jgi:hypothetical protein
VPETQDPVRRDAEQTLDVRQMVMIFLNSVIFIKIPLLIFGFRMSEEATAFNVAGFAVCIFVSVFTMTRFILKKK